MPEKRLTIEKELQRTQEDLEDLEMYIGEFSSFLPLAVCTITPARVIIDNNKAFGALTNYKPEEINGEFLEVLFPNKKDVQKVLKKVQEEGSVKTKELTLLSKKKKEIPVNISVSARKDKEGNFIGYFIAISDITEIKKSREEMEEKVKIRTKDLERSRTALMNMLEDIEESRKRAEEEKNKTLAVITNFTDGLLMFDRGNKLSLVNPKAEDFFDVKRRDIIGRPILELSTFPTIEPVVTLVGGEIKEVFRKEIQVNEHLVLEVSTVSIIREEEKLGTLIILHNITREKLIERMKTEFVSLAAHQLRTPLSAIKWTLRMLLDEDLGKITEEQRDFIEKTYRSNERMIALINDLLDVTRIEEGRYLYKPAFTQFENITQFVINSYKEEAKRRKIRLEFKKPKKKLPKVKVDVEKIRLAIQNLLDNAVRYTRPGGKVTVSLKYAKKEIEFSIQDSGIGIPEDQKERVFTKFFRGTNVLRLETEGSGLGLFITKNVIEAHGGKIWFESKEDQGTAFYFTIPVKEEFAEFLKEF